MKFIFSFLFVFMAFSPAVFGMSLGVSPSTLIFNSTDQIRQVSLANPTGHAVSCVIKTDVSWIVFPEREITVPANSLEKVQISINPKMQAGSHTGKLIVSALPDKENSMVIVPSAAVSVHANIKAENALDEDMAAYNVRALSRPRKNEYKSKDFKGYLLMICLMCLVLVFLVAKKLGFPFKRSNAQNKTFNKKFI